MKVPDLEQFAYVAAPWRTSLGCPELSELTRTLEADELLVLTCCNRVECYALSGDPSGLLLQANRLFEQVLWEGGQGVVALERFFLLVSEFDEDPQPPIELGRAGPGLLELLQRAQEYGQRARREPLASQTVLATELAQLQREAHFTRLAETSVEGILAKRLAHLPPADQRAILGFAEDLASEIARQPPPDPPPTPPPGSS